MDTGTRTDLTAPGAHLAGPLSDDEVRELRRRCVAPSEIAVLTGRGDQSAVRLWERKRGGILERPAMTNPAGRGWGWGRQPHLVDLFAARHGDLDIAATGRWLSRGEPQVLFQPHRVLMVGGTREVTGALTLRSRRGELGALGYGPSGSDQVPLDIYDHQQWLIHCLGLTTDQPAYVMAWGDDDTDIRTYPIHRNQEHIDMLCRAVREFLTAVADGTPPMEGK
jgi:hypothetical protein